MAGLTKQYEEIAALAEASGLRLEPLPLAEEPAAADAAQAVEFNDGKVCAMHAYGVTHSRAWGGAHCARDQLPLLHCASCFELLSTHTNACHITRSHVNFID